MSLLTTDITKVKRLSLREVKLPAPEVKPPTPILVKRPPTGEEIAYSKLVAINPLIEKLVERLGLVSSTTGKRIRKVDPEIKTQEIDRPKLIALAQRVIKPESSYTKGEIIERIKEATNVGQERAERGFILMLQAGAIEQTTNQEIYYLTGSIPF